MDEGMESSNDFLEWLRESARRELQRRQDHPESDEAQMRDMIRRQLRHEHPDWDESALAEIEEDMAGVYRLLPEVCRERLRQARPNLDEVELQMVIMLNARPPNRLVERELLRRMHLASGERVQQVAVMMADKVLGT